MEPHQERVLTEKKELDEKREKLGVFLKGDHFRKLPPAERARLEEQAIVMRRYSEILNERIGAF